MLFSSYTHDKLKEDTDKVKEELLKAISDLNNYDTPTDLESLESYQYDLNQIVIKYSPIINELFALHKVKNNKSKIIYNVDEYYKW